MQQDILGDIATWVGSIGTIAAFAVAFIQIRRERVERHKREFREWMLAKREHADRVSAWVSADTVTITNASHHLIHDVEVTLADGAQLTVDHVEPGVATFAAGSEHVTSTVASLRFTDVRGDRWMREAGHPPVLLESAPGTEHHTPRRPARSAAPA